VLLDALALDQLAPQLISHAQKRAGPTTFENVQTSFKHPIGKVYAYFYYSFEQLAHMLCGMRKIQDAQGVGPMPRGFWFDTSLLHL